MASIQSVISSLRQAEQELVQQLEGVRTAISSLAGSATAAGRGRPAGKRGPGRPKGSGNNGIIIVGGKTKRKRRKMSAATIAKMRKSQQARWAKVKAAKK